MTGRFTMSRRALLRGAVGGVATSLALPPLDAMFDGNGVALAAGGEPPRRFGVWFWGNGVRLKRWTPAGNGPNYELTDGLLPFAAVKPYLTVVSGMSCKSSGTVHHAGTAGMLTGTRPQGDKPSTFALPSIDVVAARAQPTPLPTFPALHVGVYQSGYAAEGSTGQHLSHNGPNSVNPAEVSARGLFDRLFAGGAPRPSTPAGADPAARGALVHRASVLDAVLEDAASLRERLGAEDRKRLDQHLEGIRALELRLRAPATPGGAASSCKAPPRPAELAANGALEPRNQAMADVLALGLACDLTRVFSFHFDSWPAPTFRELGHTEGQHALTHNEGGDQPMVHASVVFKMKQFAYLLERLKAIPEGAGTVLDNCAILGTSDVAEGSSHSLSNMPILIAGRAGGKLKAGVHHRAGTDNNASTVHLTVLRALGLPVNSFGAGQGLTTAVIPGLLA